MLNYGETMSLPSRERGLKSYMCEVCGKKYGSLPSRERGLKSYMCEVCGKKYGSLPSRERGLKCQ